MRGERSLLVDQQHEVLLAHQRLESAQASVAHGRPCGAQAADRREAALVDRAPRHADIEQRRGRALRAARRSGYATSARRCASAAARDAAGSCRPSAAAASSARVDADGGLQRRRAVDRTGTFARPASRSCRATRRAPRRSAGTRVSCIARNGLSAAAGLRSARTCSAVASTEAINGLASENISYCSRSGCSCRIDSAIAELHHGAHERLDERRGRARG